MDRTPLRKNRPPATAKASSYDFSSWIRYPINGNPNETLIPDENMTRP